MVVTSYRIRTVKSKNRSRVTRLRLSVAGRGRQREEATISELVQRLRDRGWRLTVQRRVVAEVLAGDHVHLTADAVHSRAQLVLPEISLATVYNTLNELVDMGEVLEISAGDGPKRYDPNTTIPHHHLYCVECGALRDVNPEGTDAGPARQPAARLRADRRGHRLPGPLPRLPRPAPPDQPLD